jgi:hypothetical protein
MEPSAINPRQPNLNPVLPMPSYLWSGKDSTGKEITDRITADTPEAARDQLLARGWTELRWETTEVHDFVKREMNAVTPPQNQPELSPEQEKAYLRGTAPGFWSLWAKSTRDSAVAFAILAVWLLWGIAHHRMWNVVLPIVFILLLLFLYPALHFWFRRTGTLFHQLHSARNWRRWDEVLATLEKLRKIQASHLPFAKAILPWLAA